MKARLKVYCSISNLPQVREFMRKNLREMDVDRRVSEQVVLAVDEACTNSMIHQHNCDECSCIELAVYRKENQLHIELKDSGEAFPIDSYEALSMEDRILTHQKGGMGVLLIRSIMDNIEILQKNGFHVFKFIKELGK